MNDSQAIFTIFFAISWGIVSNVLPRWKPFHFAMFGERRFPQPMYRAVVAFLLLNILPWVFFACVLVSLGGEESRPREWNLRSASWILPRAILPGLLPFRFYRVWVAVIQFFPSLFYAQNQSEVPELFRLATSSHTDLIEPDITHLPLRFIPSNGTLRAPGRMWNLFFGFMYISVPCFCFGGWWFLLLGLLCITFCVFRLLP